ncbi:hypothetical protein [Nocardia nova]|jgi:hypothetical protein|uniref:hypothetical protein n=1 Tax=Nocardia nova TaxID=37330 RepID=UPI001894C369|nr:hypothetical protein [Nocardia nova]MBF6148639.1 hypothetical protein [Nocardia nova]
MVFGISSSGLIVLEAARTLPQIRKIALYEPALLRAGETRYTDWLPRFDREMAAGKVGAALITCMYGFDLAPPRCVSCPAACSPPSPTRPCPPRTRRPVPAT